MKKEIEQLIQEELNYIREQLAEQGLPSNGSTFEVQAASVYAFYYGEEDED